MVGKADLEGKGHSSSSWPTAVALSSLYILFVACHCGQVAVDGLWAIGWDVYVAVAFAVATVRQQVRIVKSIEGNLLQDFFLSLLFLPNVTVQMDETILVHHEIHDLSS